METDRRYKGHTISRTSSSDSNSKRWYVRAAHDQTGIEWYEQESAQFPSLAAAREWIDQLVEFEGKS